MEVHDPFGAQHDPELSSLRLALDPAEGKRRLKRRLPRLAGPDGIVRVQRARVIRYKPGRRCVVEYDVRVLRPGAPSTNATLVGKVRAGRYGNQSYELLDRLWRAGLREGSSDGILVPEPLGVVWKLRMWVQRKAPGQAATKRLAGSKGPALARRIAEAAHKVHRSGVPAPKRHTIADELRILSSCLRQAGYTNPSLARRIERVLVACERLGRGVGDPPRPCGIHRDFYADQVIVDGERLFLIDFDLYCLGDPALDIGNFIGHVAEQSLRTTGDPGAFGTVEDALRDRYIELAGDRVAGRIESYAILTLARHIYLSTMLPGRAQFTAPILEACEERLGSFRRGREDA
jgi:tRNA A-37 threonylcarbamoyl transferase component Bud32